MKSSIFVAASSALLAMASPLEKRVMETDIVTKYYTVTVTGASPTFIPEAKPTTAAPAPAPPAPTTTSPTVVVVTITPDAHQVAPTTQKEEPTSSSSSKTSVASPAPAGDDLISNTLYQHNIHRANHSAPALTWDDTIAGYAAITAKTCVFAHDMTEGDGGYGQNIASWGGTNAQSLGAVGAAKMASTDMWYNGEVNSFLPSYYGQATPDMNTFETWGHFSQLVWKSTQSVGCAVQFCPAGTMFDGLDAWFTVCNYDPPGNVAGAYGDNILVSQNEATVTV
ncbi:CAP domain-containing protein [Xylariaceae sp. FL0255]|nr:CAP domain-containing protein [Xylariaceae sp. FL0255]